MEMYIYECPVCGLRHQVPAYWVSFSPTETFQFPHIRFDTKEMCENIALNLVEE